MLKKDDVTQSRSFDFVLSMIGAYKLLKINNFYIF